MSDCRLFAGDPRGKKCGVCGEPLRISDIIYEWGGVPCEVGCLIRYATERLSPPYHHEPPGSNWAP